MYDCTLALKQEFFLVPRFLVVTTRGNGSITLIVSSIDFACKNIEPEVLFSQSISLI